MKKHAKNKTIGLISFVKNKWKVIIPIALILAGIFFYANSKSNQVSDLEFIKPEYKTLTQTLEVSGVVDAKQKARLRFLAGGKLTYIGAKEGEMVKKWQTLASIDQASLKKQLEQYLNLYSKQRSDYEQFRDDNLENKEGIAQIIPSLSTRRELDKTQWDLENSVLNVEIQDIAVKNTALVSPLNGILVTAPENIAGTQITASDYFEIIDPKTFVFKVAVDETDIAKLKLGQETKIELDAYPDTQIKGKLGYIAFSTQQTSTGSVFLVEIPFVNIENQNNINLRLGMNGNVTINLQQKEGVLVIPLEAIRDENGKTLVDVKTSAKKFEPREIKIGLETDEEVEVLSGLSTQDEVLLPN